MLGGVRTLQSMGTKSSPIKDIICLDFCSGKDIPTYKTMRTTPLDIKRDISNLCLCLSLPHSLSLSYVLIK